MPGRLLLICCFLLGTSLCTRAAHIAGGELFYAFEKIMPNGKHHYKVTLRLFRECTSQGPRLETEVVNLGAYNATDRRLVTSVSMTYGGSLQIIRLNASAIPCISGDTNVCYQVALYRADLFLDAQPSGYILGWSRCCRANGIINIGGGSDVSATYTAYIPGTFPTNSSPVVNVKDTALVCANRGFVLDFGAVDPDNDSLSYSFTPAFGGTNSGGTAAPLNLNLPLLNYTGVYTGLQPLGNQVSINASTGAITGVAPIQSGRYVVNVTIFEWRNGQQINQHRKDFIVKVGACDFVEAKLKPIVNCNAFTTQFENQSSSSANQQYRWNFGDLSTTADTSTSAQPSYTYQDTGVYFISLEVRGAGGCRATDSARVAVYPGFKAGFRTLGLCFKVPVQFRDTSLVRYGQINSYRWNFGDASTLEDTSILQNPAYKYPQPGLANAKLIISSTKGCIDSVTTPLAVSTEPTIQLNAERRLCKGDSIQINAVVEGNAAVYSWAPATDITNTSIANPLIFPKATTTYTVQVDQDGCSGEKSVRVKVVDRISITLTAVGGNCQGDTTLLKASTDGDDFLWSPAQFVSSINTAETRAFPDSTTVFTVISTLGTCTARASTTITLFPLPTANAGVDTGVCTGQGLQLQGQITGNGFAWLPNDGSLSSTSSLTPFARPTRSMRYVLAAFGNGGCNRIVRDTVLVAVNPLPKVFAGNDTNVVNGFPLRLSAAGADGYEWMPARYFANPFLANQTIQLPVGITPILLTLRGSTRAGCVAYDTIRIVQFDGLPEIYVPTAFSPNADGRNDLLRPIPAGVQLRSFRIYNRLGAELFSAGGNTRGWDGMYRGQAQPSGTYVYVAEGVDGQNKQVLRRGTSVLIR